MKRCFSSTYLILFFLVLLPACKQDITPGQKMAIQFNAREPVTPPESTLSMQQAMVLQQQFNRQMIKWKGPIAGYKAALTSRAAQERFGTNEPVRGTLFKKMLLENGANLEISFGIRPLYEADLLVRIGDETINTAQTPLQALQAIDAVIPFIELPDLAFPEGTKLTAPLLAAINAGGRLGVFGAPHPVHADSATLQRFGTFRVKLIADDQELIAENTGAALMGHPMNVVLWLRDSLARDGIQLKKGDLLSLGSLTPIFPVTADTRITARYEGLLPDKPIEVSVQFR